MEAFSIPSCLMEAGLVPWSAGQGKTKGAANSEVFLSPSGMSAALLADLTYCPEELRVE